MRKKIIPAIAVLAVLAVIGIAVHATQEKIYDDSSCTVMSGTLLQHYSMGENLRIQDSSGVIYDFIPCYGPSWDLLSKGYKFRDSSGAVYGLPPYSEWIDPVIGDEVCVIYQITEYGPGYASVLVIRADQLERL